MAKRAPEPEKRPGFFSQIKSLFRFTREVYGWLPWAQVAILVGGVLIGLLVGYLVTDDLAAAQAGMARTDVNARWQAAMAEFFEELDLPPDQGFWQLDEVFHLEDQLAALAER